MLSEARLNLEQIPTIYGDGLKAFLVPYEVVANNQGYYFFRIDSRSKKPINVSVRETDFNAEYKQISNLKQKTLKVNAMVDIQAEKELLQVGNELFFVEIDSNEHSKIQSHYYTAHSLNSFYNSLVLVDNKDIEDFKVNGSYIFIRSGFIPFFTYLQNANNPYVSFHIDNTTYYGVSPIFINRENQGEIKNDRATLYFIGYDYSGAYERYTAFLNESVSYSDYGIISFDCLKNALEPLSNSNFQGTIYTADVSINYALFSKNNIFNNKIKLIETFLSNIELAYKESKNE